MVIKVAGHEYCVTNKPKRHSKSLSLGSISDIVIEVEKTKTGNVIRDKNCGLLGCENNIPQNYCKNYCDNEIIETTLLKMSPVNIEDEKDRGNKSKNRNSITLLNTERDFKKKSQQRKSVNKQTTKNSEIVHQQTSETSSTFNNLSKSKSEGNPFQHRKRGKIVKVDRTKGKII